MEKPEFQRLAEDIKFIKDQIKEIKIDLDELTIDIHTPVRQEYLEKLGKTGKGKFLSRKEFEKELGVSI